MYIWRIDRLKTDLRSGSFADRDVLPYVIAWVALVTALAEMAAYAPYEAINVWTYSLSALMIGSSIIGTLVAYRANGRTAGVHFANRFLSLGFVLTVRFLVFLIPAMAVLVAYWAMNFDAEEPIPVTFVDVALSALLQVVFYWRLAKHFRDVAAT